MRSQSGLGGLILPGLAAPAEGAIGRRPAGGGSAVGRPRAGRRGTTRGAQPEGPGAPVASTRFSYALLLLFLLLLYSNVAMVVPQLEVLAPAQTVAVGALAVLALERTVHGRGLVLTWPDTYLLLAFAAAAALSTFTSLWMRYSVEQTLVLLRYVAVYLLLVNTIESWRRLRTVTAVLVVGGLFPAFGTLANLSAGVTVEGERVAWMGTFGNPNDLAYSLVLLMPLALGLTVDSRGWRRLLFAAAAGIYAVAIFSTYSRGGLIGLGVVVALAVYRWSRPWLKLPALAAATLALALVVTTSWARDEGFAELVQDTTVNQRLDTIRAGLGMFADNPVLGVGLGCSAIGWPIYAPPTAFSQGWLHSHNTLIQLLCETGLIGTALFVTLFAVALVRCRRLARRWRREGWRERGRAVSAVEISLWGIAACGLSGGYVLSWFPYLILGLASAIGRLGGPPETPPGAALLEASDVRG